MVRLDRIEKATWVLERKAEGEGSSSKAVQKVDPEHHTTMAASESGDDDTGKLLAALYHKATKSEANPKPLVRHTIHHVVDEAHPGKRFDITSWKTVEFAYRKADSVGVDKDLPTLARGLFTLALPDDDDDGNQPESSADAMQRERQRILVRGYDKFFNVGEMAWTKPASIERYSSPPYILSFKENGCIIFIGALSPTQLVVTSKHALESLKANEPDDDVAGEQAATHPARQSVSHAAKGEEWVGKHLARVGKTKADLAAELWRRGETAVAELCDDSFEEHVLAYPPEKSGLHLHGLNSNTVNFKTRSLSDVDDFARQWGFIPTRYLTMQSMEEVNAFTDRIGTTGEWEGEAIEGFVVRTTMPKDPPDSDPWAGHVSPPYSPGQTWFYKVKFDEPYLMYRDWRELAKKMLTERDKWQEKLSKGSDGEGAGESGTNGKSEEAATASKSVEASVASLNVEENVSDAAADGTKKSKKQLKREHKEAMKHTTKAQGAAHSANGAPDPPAAPKARSDRPETKLFIRWCYDRVYGSADGSVRPQPNLFAGIQSGKGIIRLRDTFLAYLDTEEGKARLKELGGARGALAAKLNLGETPAAAVAAPPAPSPDANRPYTHLLILPIAVPGCGKTSLFHSLSHLYPTSLTHTQSDDVPTKKSGPTFLKNICAELSKKRVVLADRNNHLLQHRDEIVEAVRGWEERGGRTEEEVRGERKRRQQMERAGKVNVEPAASDTPPGSRPRVKFLALVYTLDLLSLNALHRLLSDRILLRGSNHQSLVADTASASGCRTHEKILWRFLEAYEPFGSAEGKGEGDKGRGDAQMDVVLNLGVELDVRQQLEKVLRCWSEEGVLPESEGALLEQVKGTTPAQLAEAVEAAKAYKATPLKKAAAKEASVPVAKPRYYGIAVEMDIAQFLAPLLTADGQDEASSARIGRARQLLDDLSSGRRVVQRPHITLVHNSNTRQPEEGQPDDLTTLPESEQREVLAARRRWARYSSLCASSESAGVDFDISFDRLCWEGQRVMTLSVSSVRPRETAAAKLSYEEMMELQGKEWRAHVTVGTCSEEVRPYEANRVAREVDALVAAGEREGGKEEEEKIEWIELPLRKEGEEPKVQGRLVGMS